ncbi:MAG: CBS domain-containing protein [Acidobacteriota bacterium]
MHEYKDKWSVGAWMTSNPETVTPDTPVTQAFYQMRRLGFRQLPVVQDGQLVGIVTDRDLRRPDLTDEPDGWNNYYQLDRDTEVTHVMTEKVLTLSPPDPLEKALDLFLENKFGGLPVLDRNDQVIGIMTVFDLMGAFRAALDDVGDSLRQ